MYKIRQLKSLNREIVIPADKSISHRALILSSIVKGQTQIKPFLHSNDTFATLDCIKQLGVKTELQGDGSLIVEAQGRYLNPKMRRVVLEARESGTTMRMLAGLLCAQRFPVLFSGSVPLNNRPMERIVRPLKDMGANIDGQRRNNDIYPPLEINPVNTMLSAINYKMPIASAQVKSAILLASLYAKGITSIEEPFKSRDHTEHMLKCFGADIKIESSKVSLNPKAELKSPKEIFIPSDFSSAAFFIVLGLILKGSQITVRNVNINPTRAMLLDILKRMGADIEIINKNEDLEPYADIIVRSSSLKSTVVSLQEVPAMIDEIQILCVAAAFAKGQTTISGVEELRVKETDRIESIIANLRAAGVGISSDDAPCSDTSHRKIQILRVEGASSFKKAEFKSQGDHRTAMSAIILGAAMDCDSFIDDIKCINKSFPEFTEIISGL
jgi:3-phosphoshikimate 1-carboxyvinyltransferase